MKVTADATQDSFIFHLVYGEISLRVFIDNMLQNKVLIIVYVAVYLS